MLALVDQQPVPRFVHLARVDLARNGATEENLLAIARGFALDAYVERQEQRRERRRWLRTLAREHGLDETAVVGAYDAGLRKLIGIARHGTSYEPHGDDSDSTRHPVEGGLLETMLADGSFAPIYSARTPPPRPECVISPAVVAGELNFVHAPPKSSKSNFVFYAACQALRGEDPVPGVFTLGGTRVRRVLVLTEMSAAMAHGFLDLYDPDYELRSSGRLLVASANFKALLTSPAELRRCVTRVVQQEGTDLVVIDTYTAFSSMGSGDSISEAAHAIPMVNALQAIPATVWCVHHDRKSIDKAEVHTNMLGTTALRAASSANLALRVENLDSTLMHAELEARDPSYLRYLAQRAEALAAGQEPPPEPEVAKRKWSLRLGWDEERGMVVYREAEADPVGKGRGSLSQRGDEDELIQSAAREALRVSTREAMAEDRVRVFTARTLVPVVADRWDGERGRAPGRGLIEKALRSFPEVVFVSKGDYPGNGRAAGFGIREYLPAPLGEDRRPEVI